MENPRDPHNEGVFQRTEVTETARGPAPVRDRRPPPGMGWVWVALLLIVVIGLVWYVLTRGERVETPLQVPEIQTPVADPPRQEIEVEVRQQPAPAPAPQQPASPPEPEPAPPE
jgi:hypothetical protein